MGLFNCVCCSTTIAGHAGVRGVAAMRDPERFAAALRGMCERHLDELCVLLRVPLLQEATR